MFGHRIEIDDELFDQIKQCASSAGYASPEEFVSHVLEKEVRRLLTPAEENLEAEEKVKKRLQGLGYIE